MKKIYFVLFSLLFVIKGYSVIYNLKAGGTYTNPADWGTNTAGTTGAPASFSGSHVWNLTNSTTNNTLLTLNASWTVTSGGTINFGDGTNASTIILTSANVFTTGSQPNLVFRNNCRLTLQANQLFLNSGKTNFQNGSTCEFATGASSIQGLSYKNLLISSNITTYTNSAASASNVTINSGITFSVLNNYTLTITGVIAGAGNIFSDFNPQVINLTGTGNVGTINFDPSGYLPNLNISLGSAASTVALGTDYIASGGTLSLVSGILNLNGKALTLDAQALTCTSGSLAATNTSSLFYSIAAGVTQSGSLLFASSANTIGLLEINNNGNNLTLGSPLFIPNLISVIDGTITTGGNLIIAPLAGTSATIGATGNVGSITGDYSVTGTSTSTLIINEIGDLPGNLNMTSGSSSLSALTINAAGRTITLGNQLNMMDFLTVTDGTLASGGNLNLVAGNGRIGSVAPMGATGAITGNVVVNSFFPGTTATGWCMLGSNGVSGQTIGDMQNKFTVTCSNCNITPAAAGGFTSVQGLDPTTCAYVTNLTTASSLGPGVGYFVYLGTNFSGNSADMTWSYTGALTQQSLNVSIDGSGGCPTAENLIANPYASPISWTSLYNNGANSGVVADVVYYFKRPGTGAASTFQQGGSGTNGGTDIIPAGQGFQVQNVAFATDNLLFTESVKSTVNTTNLSKQASGGKTELNETNGFRLWVEGAYDKDDALFHIKPTGNLLYQKRGGDALKLYANPGSNWGIKFTAISSVDPNGTELAQNTFPALSYSVSIPVKVRVSASGTYTLHAADFDNYQSCIVIKDKLTGAVTDLKVKDYVFTINDTTSTPRFELMVCANGAAPVSLNEFFASSNISINQDAEGVIVKTSFTDNTKSTISAYNLIGQKIVDDVILEGNQTAHINIDNKNQVVLIKVVNDKESLTKKILIH